jgi:hypothetical protein
MKKTIVTLLIGAFCLTGCSFGKSNSANTAVTPQPKEETTPAPSNLMDWLKTGEAVVCTVNTLNGDVNIKAKDNKIRIDGIPYLYDQATSSATTENATQLGTSLTIGDDQYLWSGAKGTKINRQALSELSGGQTDEQMDTKTWQDQVSDWQEAGFNYQCAKQSLSDDLFTPPTDIQFTDLAAVLSQLQNLTQTPTTTGATDSTAPTKAKAETNTVELQ